MKKTIAELKQIVQDEIEGKIFFEYHLDPKETVLDTFVGISLIENLDLFEEKCFLLYEYVAKGGMYGGKLRFGSFQYLNKQEFLQYSILKMESISEIEDLLEDETNV